MDRQTLESIGFGSSSSEVIEGVRLTAKYKIDLNLEDDESYTAFEQIVRLSFYNSIKQILLSKYRIQEEIRSKDFSTIEFFLENGCYVSVIFSGFTPNRVSVISDIKLSNRDTYITISTSTINLTDLDKWLDESINMLSSIKLSREL